MGRMGCISNCSPRVSSVSFICYGFPKSGPEMGDVSVRAREGWNFPTIRIKQSKTDISKDGIPMPLVAIDSVFRPVKTFQRWG